MLKVVGTVINEKIIEYPVISNGRWISESRKLLHEHLLSTGSIYVRDPRENDDLFTMLDNQLGRFMDYACDNKEISDKEYDAALDLYNDTWQAIDDFELRRS